MKPDSVFDPSRIVLKINQSYYKHAMKRKTILVLVTVAWVGLVACETDDSTSAGSPAINSTGGSTAVSDTGGSEIGNIAAGTGGIDGAVSQVTSGSGGAGGVTDSASGGGGRTNESTSDGGLTDGAFMTASGGAGGTEVASGGDSGADASDGGSGGGTGGDGSSGGDGGSSCPVSSPATPGETAKSIDVGGRTRTFIVHIPPGYTGQTPMPVVIDFHPLGGTGSMQKLSTGWASLADAENFMVVWPDGIGSSWNVGRCCGSAQSQNVDDVAFARAIITTLANEACIDTKRVYASGCSNGGGMAYRLACDAADAIAAVAPVDFDCITGPENDPSCASCSPSRPISEIQFRGTSDFAVPFNGGNTFVVPGLAFPGAQANLETWAGFNACTGTPQALPENSACQTYPTCEGDVDTVLCTVQNGTHCGNYSSFGIVDVAWEMFKRSALP